MKMFETPSNTVKQVRVELDIVKSQLLEEIKNKNNEQERKIKELEEECKKTQKASEMSFSRLNADVFLLLKNSWFARNMFLFLWLSIAISFCFNVFLFIK